MTQVYRDGALVDLSPDEDAAWAAQLAAEAASMQVTRTQALLALVRRAEGAITEDDILAQIGVIPDPVQRAEAKILFNNPLWKRSDPFVTALGSSFGLSSEDIDALFRAAAAI